VKDSIELESVQRLIKNDIGMTIDIKTCLESIQKANNDDNWKGYKYVV
jgi:hypothetical protein